MSHQLKARDSTYWLHNNKNKATIGPGTYDTGAAKTANHWNTNPNNGNANESKGMNSAMDNSQYANNPKSEMGKRQLIPFNSKIDRDEPDRISMQYNPGPGAYANKTSSFKHEFMTKDQINQRRIMS